MLPTHCYAAEGSCSASLSLSSLIFELGVEAVPWAKADLMRHCVEEPGQDATLQPSSCSVAEVIGLVWGRGCPAAGRPACDLLYTLPASCSYLL